MVEDNVKSLPVRSVLLTNFPDVHRRLAGDIDAILPGQVRMRSLRFEPKNFC